MRKLAYTLFLGLVLLGINCVVTDYGIITDNNQIDGKGGNGKFGPNPVIDTQGKAHIRYDGGLGMLWPDGTDEFINFVDQKADGTAVLTAYNNFSSGNEPVFHDDLYCNTNRVGCAIFTAPDNNDENRFDGVLNENCSGARSLSILVSTGRYSGECGRIAGRHAKADLLSRLEMFNSAIFATRLGREGLLYRWDDSDLDIRLVTEQGNVVDLPIRGAGELWVSAEDRVALLDMRNPLLASLLSSYAGFLDKWATDETTAVVTYNGLSVDFQIAGAHPVINSATVLRLKNQAF